MKTKREICPACGHRAYYIEEGYRDCEGQQIEPDSSRCNYCDFSWQQYQSIYGEDEAYIYRKELCSKKINWENLFKALSLSAEQDRRFYNYKCSYCGIYLNENKCPNDCPSGAFLLKLNE